MPSADELARIPLFESLTAADCQRLASWFEERTVDEGVRLIGEGAAGYSFFILLEGSAAVTSGDTALADLGPGDFFAMIAILGAGRRSATVAATSSSRLLVMFGTDFRRLQDAQPDVAGRIEEATRLRLASSAPGGRM
jgi:CRP-like cAMP-binding protein